MVSVAEIEVLVNMDTREVTAGMETIKRKTAEMGSFHDMTISQMRHSWKDFNRIINDVTMFLGRMSIAVGVAMVAVDALSMAFSRAGKSAKESLDEIQDGIKKTKQALDDLGEQGSSYEKEKAIIEAKYAPGSKEYKTAMLGLQEQMATEAYTKYGSTAALGELTAIQKQRTLLGRPTLSLMEQKAAGYGPGEYTTEGAYEYGFSPAYQKAAEAAKWNLQSTGYNLRAQEQLYGIGRNQFFQEGVMLKVPIPGAPGTSTAAPELGEIKRHLDTLVKEPRRVYVTIGTINSTEAPQKVAAKIGEATGVGTPTTSYKSR